MSDYKRPEHSRNQVKLAGKMYIKEKSPIADKTAALTIINNWRSAHAFPLQVIYMHMKKTARDNDVVAQRLKRLESITNKLKRLPNMSLCTMQDIGGCRVIVNSISDVYEVLKKIEKSRMRHKIRERYDYIEKPKKSGYRSYHLVLSYMSDRNTIYNGLLIEIQIRTHVQHLWATAVETMDAFTGDALKTGFGKEENDIFFRLVSDLLELYEQNPLEKEKIKTSKVAFDIIEHNKKHQIIERLLGIKEAINSIHEKQVSKQGYYLLRLNRKNSKLDIKEYIPGDIGFATYDYDEYEKLKSPEEDIVLVSTSSFDTLKKAYPNYFADIGEFLSLLKSLLPDLD